MGNMNYELCKKLKDVGFPQEIGKGEVLMDLHMSVDENGNGIPCEQVYIPTLSELIAACGDSFRKIVFHHSCVTRPDYVEKYGENMSWSAHSCAHFVPKRIKGKVFRGTTPEKAVANLWLEINK